MPRMLRIGIQIEHKDPFWVQVREVLWQRAQTLQAELIEIRIQEPDLLSFEEQTEVVEDMLVQDLDALICNVYPPSLLSRLLERGIPIIYVSEISLHHPRFTSRIGLYDAAFMLGAYVGENLAAEAHICIVGGGAKGQDSGQSRLDGFAAALPHDKQFVIHRIPCDWLYDSAYDGVTRYLLQHPDLRPNAIFGLSDLLVLATCDAFLALGRRNGDMLSFGINGDPLALAAIADGRMTATVETDIDDLAAQVVDLAYRAACGAQLPEHFRNRQRMVTAENIPEVAMRKMLSLATLPTRLVDVNKRNVQQRIVQLETSSAIDRQVGLILDEHQLSLAITALIRDSYGFDDGRFLIWDPQAGQLSEVGGLRQPGAAGEPGIDPSGPFAFVLAHNRTVFIPDTNASHRFLPDPLWAEVRARVVVPVHLGGQIVGLLDLHRHQVAHYAHEEIDGLQILADRLGLSLRNAELYSQAIKARALAEKADQLKTVLLANVSHELRTPLNIILGYSRFALDRSARHGSAFDAELAHDLRQIYDSGEHLLRLINDLLDLSRAEIGELSLQLETIDMHSFLNDVFQSTAKFSTNDTVVWRLDLPAELPQIEGDAVRLRQILLNLLHNASKFTQRGQISLGAEAAAPDLHIWVADTGPGIAKELQEQIFEPFVSAGNSRGEGAGLGLSITRRLVALHRGRIHLESRPGHGSTFHIYLPLPETTLALQGGGQPTLLFVSEAAAAPASLVQLAERRGLTLRICPSQKLPDVLATTQPAALAVDLASSATTGWQIAEQIRALSHIPVMFYQGDHDSVFSTTNLLTKPFSASTLIEALSNFGPLEPAGRILIVEDDPQTRALHRRVIAEHFANFTIHDVGGGRAAIERLSRETPHLVILDLAMPELDGFAVLEHLRADPRTSAVPVLVLSGRALSPDDVRRLSEQRVVFQTKGVLSEPELAEAFRRTIARDAALPPQTSMLVKQAIGFIQAHYHELSTLQEIADALSVNRHYLGRIFAQEIGLSPWQYLIRYRVLCAKDLLRASDYSVADVAARVGFDTATYFSHIFHREVGCSPREFRAQARY